MLTTAGSRPSTPSRLHREPLPPRRVFRILTGDAWCFRYADYDHMGFGHLRVLNEDRVESGTGFGTHPHREFEIFSYIVDGELEQCVSYPLSPIADVRMLIITFVYSKDSMGNTEVMRRGDLQMTSAGTGIRHSEKCHGPKQVHFLQIWASPNESNLSPKYYTRFAFSPPRYFSLKRRLTKPRISVYSGISPMKIRRTNGHMSSPRLPRTARRSSISARVAALPRSTLRSTSSPPSSLPLDPSPTLLSAPTFMLTSSRSPATTLVTPMARPSKSMSVVTRSS
jgi:hypothetical protein